MGTTKEWGEVLFAAILWGGGMLLFRRIEGKIPKDVVLIYSLGAVLFGLVASFPLKRVFSFPLMFIPLGIIVVLLIWIRQKRRLTKTVNS
jgi:ABC-type iron transport system FetAB permease component